MGSRGFDYEGPEFKNLHVNVKAALVLIFVSVIVFILLAIYFIYLIPYNTYTGFVPMFSFIFLLIIALIMLNTNEPNKNYLKRGNIDSEDRTLLNAYSGLYGAWKNPVVSKQVRLEIYKKLHQQANWINFNNF